MSDNFITNAPEKTLKERINTLIGISEELKFIIGFFYLSGWHGIKEKISDNPNLIIKILVGLEVDKYLGKIIEIDTNNKNLSIDNKFENFLKSLDKSINNNEMDTQEVYKSFSFLLDLIKSDRIKIRKTKESNHAKLYLFKLDDNHKKLQENLFITGSSNLTRSGLESQQEFNIEIKDYGFDKATNYFDDLWEDSIQITENEENRKKFLELLQYKTLVARITPFEAYVLVLKTYIDLQNQKKILPTTENVLEKLEYKKYKFQLDAVNQALNIIDQYNGVIIADVVGLGKSIIASLIAKNLDESQGLRGIIICPPALKNNWDQYKDEFKLHRWEIHSKGKINEVAENINDKEIDVVIVDEAHHFRNSMTDSYDLLSGICQSRKVILITATPFNNSPEDIYSLLKLFIIPGKSQITLDNNLEFKFKAFKDKYKKLVFILKNYKDDKTDEEVQKAKKKYKELFSDIPYKKDKIKDELKSISKEMKKLISPLVIRRNRLDLLNDFEYKQEIQSFSKIADPKQIYFELSEEQDKFYDEVIKYFDKNESGSFTGSIYQPYKYKKKSGNNKEDMSLQRQKNLFDFMRRLLIRRFESSFGAFKKSIDNFLEIHEIVEKFINNNNKYILNKKLIKLCEEQNLDEDRINELIKEYKNKEIFKGKYLEEYSMSDTSFNSKYFKQDIENDINLFKKIKNKLEELKLVDNDPKVIKIMDEVQNRLSNNNDRKIIIFSEYIDTILHIKGYFEKQFPNSVLVCADKGKLNKKFITKLNEEFDAQYKKGQVNNHKILLTTDKLSEGVNLNRAGIIINYDIPWNPTKVIQRLGRINRIGCKVYDELYIYNCFPSLKVSDHVKVEEIAKHKMLMIHHLLGEDAKIFDEFEEPDEAKLFTKINQNPDDYGEINIITEIRNQYNDIQKKYPEVIEKIKKLPNKVKTSKSSNKYQLNILNKKGLNLFCQCVNNADEIQEISIDEFLVNIKCDFYESRLELSDKFWDLYKNSKEQLTNVNKTNNSNKKYKKVITNLESYLKLNDDVSDEDKNFAETLKEDMEYYFTLPEKTIKKLSKQDNIESIKKTIEDLKKRIGNGYLEKIKKRISNIEKDIVICIENIG